MIRKILTLFADQLSKRNLEFKGRHAGEECYLIGNGASIKKFDLDCFSDKISIGCNSLFLHKDLSSLNLQYYVDMHPFAASPVWGGEGRWYNLKKNPFYKIEKENRPINYIKFVNLSNFVFTFLHDGYRYVHNLNRLPVSQDSLSIERSSALTHGATRMMIALSIYMGFKKVYLVGFDYMFRPMASKHFYDQEDPVVHDSSRAYPDQELLSLMSNSKQTSFYVIAPKGFDSLFNKIDYEEFYGRLEKTKEPEEITIIKYLDIQNSKWRV